MADYRRFVSYMYLYENGRKTVNSGFVRVESRNGQCRAHIHMTGIYGPDGGQYAVYMLVRETGVYIGIDVGKLQLRSQAGEMDLMTDSGHLMATKYSLENLCGMVVLGSNGRIYGTLWDDAPLDTDCFAEGRQQAERLWLFSSNRRAEVTVPSERATEMQEEEPVQEEESTEEEEPAQEEELTPQDLATEGLEEVLISQNPAIEKQTEIELDGDLKAGHDAMLKRMADKSVQTEKLTQVGKNDDMEWPFGAYDRMLAQFPQMYPFEDDQVEACVRLDLQDIGMLPMQCWVYGSNSFLLHGYYCYRHLILARIQSGEENTETAADTVYILGVPGLWQHRERYMASMFGFGNFKPISRENMDGGAFGYWYVRLK